MNTSTLIWAVPNCTPTSAGPPKFSRPLLKNWPKNLSNEYIYICWRNPLKLTFPQRKRLNFFLKFWLRRSVSEKWGLQSFSCCVFFLCWGTDYRTKNEEARFERITSWIFSTLFPTVQRQFLITVRAGNLWQLGTAKYRK